MFFINIIQAILQFLLFLSLFVLNSIHLRSFHIPHCCVYISGLMCPFVAEHSVAYIHQISLFHSCRGEHLSHSQLIAVSLLFELNL